MQGKWTDLTAQNNKQADGKGSGQKNATWHCCTLAYSHHPIWWAYAFVMLGCQHHTNPQHSNGSFCWSQSRHSSFWQMQLLQQHQSWQAAGWHPSWVIWVMYWNLLNLAFLKNCKVCLSFNNITSKEQDQPVGVLQGSPLSWSCWSLIHCPTAQDENME